MCAALGFTAWLAACDSPGSGSESDGLTADAAADSATSADDTSVVGDVGDGATDSGATAPDAVESDADTTTADPDGTATTAPDGDDDTTSVSPDADEDATTTPPDDSILSDGDDTATPPDDTGTATSDDTSAPPEDTVVAPDTSEPDIVVPPPRHPEITEVMAKNDGSLLDTFGAPSDWIEVHNPWDTPLALGGYHLSDSAADLGRFTFPAQELAPHAFVLVFASGRPASTPDELHASFKLDADGEQVILTAPDGTIVQTVALPRQVADVSYGLGFDSTVVPLVPLGAQGRVLDLGQAAPPTGWTALGFDDSAWPSGPSGYGWTKVVAIAPGPEPEAGFIASLGTPLADSVADWSTNGTQGYRDWQYGYWNRPTNGVYSTSAFTIFPNNYWSNGGWDWPNGNPPWTYIGQTSEHPNGKNNSVEHWAIRRWRATAPGTLVIAWTLYKTNTNGNGVSGHLFVDGVELDKAAVAGNDQTGVTRVLTAEVDAGSVVDLALDPTGPGGQSDDGWDGSAMSLRVWTVDASSELVGTALAPAAQVGGSLLVRHRFDVADVDALGDDARVVLGLEVDDGAAAYVNGTAVQMLNTPAALDVGGTPAPIDRNASGAPVVIDVPRELLHDGTNILALRAFDSLADDDTLAVRATLDARVVDIGTSWSYFTEPTPGAENGPLATNLPPIVGDLSDVPNVNAADPIVVRITIVPTVDAIQSAKLYYRVMFGGEVALDLTPDATTPDPYDWTAVIPASVATAGQLVRWRAVIEDAAHRQVTEPPFADPIDSEQYLGTVINDPSIVSRLPVIHWFVESPSAADTSSGTRGALYYLGELYDNVRFDIHGQSTQGFPKKSYDIDFNDTHRFRMRADVGRMADVNLLTNYADKMKVRNTLAYGTLAAAGVGYHLAFPVRVQQNGEFFSVADLVEDGDGRWLERLGKDPEGALYKMYDQMDNVNNAEKKTRKDEGKDDLQAVIDALSQNATSRAKWVWDNVDIPGMVSFAAGLVIIEDGDCCHKNYYAYRDTNDTGEWVYLPWDVDLTFGHNWTPQYGYFDETHYTQNGLWVGGNSRILKSLYEQNEFKAMVVRRLRTMMDELFQPSSTPLAQRWMETSIDLIATKIGGDAVLDANDWGLWGQGETMLEAIADHEAEWFPGRRAYLFDELSTNQKVIPGTQAADVTLQISAIDASVANAAQGWIQIHNPSATVAIDITDARLTGDVSFTMRPGTVVAPNGDLYIVADVRGFRGRTTSPKAGEKKFIQGPWIGTLSATSPLTLTDRFGHVLATFDN